MAKMHKLSMGSMYSFILVPCGKQELKIPYPFEFSEINYGINFEVFEINFGIYCICLRNVKVF